MARVRSSLREAKPILKDVVLRLIRVKTHHYTERKNFYHAWSEARRLIYRTLEWQRLKIKVQKRSRGICEGCRKRRASEIHHVVRVYDDPTLICTLSNVRHVCKACHAAVHDVDSAA